MSTLDTAVLWSATSLAVDATKLAAAGLSVRQRKLLLMLSLPATIPALAQTVALSEDDVHAALQRLVKLGLARSDATAPFNPMHVRAARQIGTSAASRTPLIAGAALAVLALAAVGIIFMAGPATRSTAPTTAAATSPLAPAPAAPRDGAPATTQKDFISEPALAAAPPRASTSPTTAARPDSPASPAATAPPIVATTLAAPTKAAPAVTLAVAPAAGISTQLAAVAATPAAGPPNTAVAAPVQTLLVAPVVNIAASVPTPATAAATGATPAVILQTPPATGSTASRIAPAPAPVREIKLVSRVEPSFPSSIGAESGKVRARLQVDARGSVTSVEIVEAVPPRVFDRSVRTALQQWRYEPTGEAFVAAAEISFVR